MNIKVVLVDDVNFSAQTGGGCAVTDCLVNIDSRLDIHSQTETLLHEILEAYLWFIPHEKIDELTDALVDGLDQLHEVTQ